MFLLKYQQKITFICHSLVLSLKRFFYGGEWEVCLTTAIIYIQLWGINPKRNMRG